MAKKKVKIAVKGKVAKKAAGPAQKATAPVKFVDGMAYPWGRAKGLLNIFWALIPILGGFATIGYLKTIVNNLVAGNTKGLPLFGRFWENTGEGLKVFVFLLPLMVVYVLLSSIPYLGGVISAILALFFMPYLVIKFLVKGEFMASLDVQKAVTEVFGNLGEYAMALLKTFAFYVVYGLLSIVLIGIPCLKLGQCFYLADFYRRHS